MEQIVKRASTIFEVDAATVYTEALPPAHPFFTDFSGMRGLFRENRLFRALNVNPADFSFHYETNRNNRVLVFLAGMRGSGKSTELARYARELDNPNGFFVVYCNVDKELSLEHVEYMDILIYQLERLLSKAEERDIKLDNDILKRLRSWFSERAREISSSLGGKIGAELGASGELPWLLRFFGDLRLSMSGAYDRAEKIRTVFKNNFNEFALRFNEFVLETEHKFREKGVAQGILFILDGLEKTNSAATRHKIIVADANRIRNIRANMLFTLPLELLPETRQIKDYAEVITFPFVKIAERDGQPVENAVRRFTEFVYKRIDPALFDGEAVVQEAVRYSGGSPRELLRLLQNAAYECDPTDGKITTAALRQAVDYLSADAQFLTERHLEILRTLKQYNEQGRDLPYLDGIQQLLENGTIMEYNDGTFKLVNPIIAHSKIYRQHVGEIAGI